jgi:uncharacterized protein (TIGR03083 family)
MDRTAKLQHLLQTSERLAVAAQRDLTAQVEHCPDWTGLDLVAHIAGVQWFWATIVEDRVQDRESLQRPGPIPANVDPIDWFRTQTNRLHSALSKSSDSDRVWTWWPDDQSVGFVLTRQVNEVVVHCFDACNATGADPTIDPDLAVLGLQEFVDVMSKDPVEDAVIPPPLHLAATDRQWNGTLFPEGVGEPITVSDSAESLLLTMWGRSAAPDPRLRAALTTIDLN